MLTPDELEDYAYDLTGGSQDKLGTAINNLIIDNYVLATTIQPGDVAALNRLNATQRDQITKLLAKYNPVVKKEAIATTKTLLETSDDAEVAALAALYGGTGTKKSEYITQTAVGIAQVIGRDNVSMGEQANKLWYQVSAQTITDYATSTKTLDQLIAQGVKELTDKGLTSIQYVGTDGRKTVRNQVDVAIRRHAMTQANQAGARMTLERLQEFGHDLVYVSQHMDARPEHQVWQGKAYSVSGERIIDGVTYPDFYDATGYGSVTGLCGANCRHNFTAYYPDDTMEEPMDADESRKQYEASQQQRKNERDIRECKRSIYNIERAGGNASAQRIRLGNLQAKQRGLIAENSFLTRQPKREKAYGIGEQPKAQKTIAKHSTRMPELAIEIDKIVPCLERVSDGAILDTTITEVSKSRTELKGLNSKTGWYINWYTEMNKVHETNKKIFVYKLEVAESNEIQGLIGMTKPDEAGGVPSLLWAVANPKSQAYKVGHDGKEYHGIGGHLFAAACGISKEWGCDGVFQGRTASAKMTKHYVDELEATKMNDLRIFVDDISATTLMEKYNYRRL